MRVKKSKCLLFILIFTLSPIYYYNQKLKNYFSREFSESYLEVFQLTKYIKNELTKPGKASDQLQQYSKEILILNKNEMLERILYSLRIKYKISTKIDFNSKDFSIIMFQDYDEYLKSKEDSNFIDNVVKNKIGLMVFNSKTNIKEEEITDCYLGDNEFMNEFLFITKNNKQRVKINKKIKITNNFRQLFAIQEKFNSILKCEKSNNQIEDILTVGKIDDIDHVFINSVNLDDIWLLNSLFIDSIRYLSKQEINFSLRRYVLVDIDDIFTTKIKESDFKEMIRLQNVLTEKYFNHDSNSFKLNLGMSGFFYSQDETGDRLLVCNNFI